MNSADNSGTNKVEYIGKHAVIAACFFSIGQIYFGIFQTSAGAIALFEDGQYHLVSQRKPLSKYFCADIDKEMVR